MQYSTERAPFILFRTAGLTYYYANTFGPVVGRDLFSGSGLAVVFVGQAQAGGDRFPLCVLRLLSWRALLLRWPLCRWLFIFCFRC